MNLIGIVSLFDEISNFAGERTAIVTEELLKGESEHCFLELQFRSRVLANVLHNRLATKRGSVVLLACDGCALAELVGMLACMRVGATFVPISEKLHNLEDIIDILHPHAAIVVGDGDAHPTVASLAHRGVFRCALLDETGDLVEAKDVEEYLEVHSYQENSHPIYIFPTSGSTGNPKYVRGTEEGLLNRLKWQWKMYPFTHGYEEVVLRRTPMAFIDTLAEIFSPLTCTSAQASLWVPSRERLRRRGIDLSLATTANAAGVSRITVIPSQLHVLLSTCKNIASVWPALKVVFVSGETLSTTLVDTFSSLLPRVTLVNLYGSTEVAGDVTFFQAHPLLLPSNKRSSVHREGSPIGVAIDGNSVKVIDGGAEVGCSVFRTVDSGEIGELLVGGMHVAQGYAERKEHQSLRETVNGFVHNPVIDGVQYFGRYFRTGDLAYQQSDGGGCHYWVGRVDNQVKIRGERVELEGIEAAAKAILPHPQPAIAALCLSSEKEEKGGILILVLESTEEALTAQLRAGLMNISRTKINLILCMKKFPRTVAGKVDRIQLKKSLEGHSSSLPQPLAETEGLGSSTPLTYATAMAAICTVFDRVLRPPPQIERMLQNPHDPATAELTFKSIGGDSLSAIECRWALHKSLALKFIADSWNVNILSTSIGDLAKMVTGDGAFTLTSSSTSSMRKRARAADEDTERPNTDEFDRKNVKWQRIGTVPMGGTHQAHLAAFKMSMCVDAPPLVHYDDESGRVLVFAASHGGDVVCSCFSNFPDCDGSDSISVVWTTLLNHPLMENSLRHVEGAAVLSHDKRSLFMCSYMAVESEQDLNVENSTHKGALWCIDASNGKIKWVFPVPDLCKSAPVLWEKDDSLDDDIAIFGCYNGMCYFVACEEGTSLGQISLGGAIFAQPLLLLDPVGAKQVDGAMLLTATTTGRIHGTRCEATSDKIRSKSIWSQVLKAPVFATPVLCGEIMIIAAVDGSVRGVQCIDGSCVWETSLPRPVFSSPRLSTNNEVLGSCVILGCHDGWLRCLKASSGEIKWMHDLGCAIFSQPYAFESGDDMVVSTTAGEVIVLGVQEETKVYSKFSHLLPAECFSSARGASDGASRLFSLGARNDLLYIFTWKNYT